MEIYFNTKRLMGHDTLLGDFSMELVHLWAVFHKRNPRPMDGGFSFAKKTGIREKRE